MGKALETSRPDHPPALRETRPPWPHGVGSRAVLSEVLLDFEDFQKSAPIGVPWEFQQDGMRSCRKLQRGGSVAQEFVVNEDFRAVRFGRDGNGAHGLRYAREEVFSASEDSTLSAVGAGFVL